MLSQHLKQQKDELVEACRLEHAAARAHREQGFGQVQQGFGQVQQGMQRGFGQVQA